MYCLRYAHSKTSRDRKPEQRETELPPATGTKQILDTRVQPQQLNLTTSLQQKKEKRPTTLEYNRTSVSHQHILPFTPFLAFLPSTEEHPCLHTTRDSKIRYRSIQNRIIT
jgi:hypothetical protein